MTLEQMEAFMAAARRLDDYAATVADRDNRIRQAHAAGLSSAEIAMRAKISRNTVAAVLGGWTAARKIGFRKAREGAPE